MSQDTPASSRPAGSGRRGPLRLHPPRRPTGFRIDDATRVELEIAAAMFAGATLQSVIREAVVAYLDNCRANPDFLRAVEAAKDRRGS
jgi:hypothetical protein